MECRALWGASRGADTGGLPIEPSPDIIWGVVTQVLNEHTFELRATHYRRGNLASYRRSETVRISGLHQLVGLTGRSREQGRRTLESQLLGKQVRVEIISRDPQGRLVADIRLARAPCAR